MCVHSCASIAANVLPLCVHLQAFRSKAPAVDHVDRLVKRLAPVREDDASDVDKHVKELSELLADNQVNITFSR